MIIEIGFELRKELMVARQWTVFRRKVFFERRRVIQRMTGSSTDWYIAGVQSLIFRAQSLGRNAAPSSDRKSVSVNEHRWLKSAMKQSCKSGSLKPRDREGTCLEGTRFS